MQPAVSSREFREEIVGKTISAVIARPGREGQPPLVLMLRFEDGSVVEFVSPRSDRLLRRSLAQRAGPAPVDRQRCETGSQLALEGLLPVSGAAESEAHSCRVWC